MDQTPLVALLGLSPFALAPAFVLHRLVRNRKTLKRDYLKSSLAIALAPARAILSAQQAR